VFLAPGLASACDNIDADVPDDKCAFFVRYVDEGAEPVDPNIATRLVGQSDDPPIRSYALIVAVSQYPNFALKKDRELPPAEHDRKNLVDFFERQKFEEIIVLSDAAATRENINFFLETYLDGAADARSGRARIVFAYSGHGGPGANGQAGSIVLSQARGVGDTPNVIKLNILAPTLINLAQKSFHFVALIGSCYSGGIFQGVGANWGGNSWYPGSPGAHVISSTAADDLAYGLGNDRGSLFFDSLIEGVTTGEADYLSAGRISLADGSKRIVGGGIARLGTVADYITWKLGEMTNPETQKPFPRPRIGSLLNQSERDGAFFFLVPPIVQVADARASTGSAIVDHPDIKVFNAPDTYKVLGMDVSHWSGEIDWQAARSKGITFAYIKATEGKTNRDDRFKANWDGARAAGIYPGAYHVFNFCRGAKDQFENIVSTVPMLEDSLPIAIDLEWYDDGPVSPKQKQCRDIEAIRRNIHDLLTLVGKRYRKLPVIYAHEKGIREIVADQFQAYPLWLQNWTKDGSPGDAGPSLSGNNPWTMWQFSGEIPFAGSQDVDLNVFFGTEEQFQSFRTGAENVALIAARPGVNLK
jgi:lysozyme